MKLETSCIKNWPKLAWLCRFIPQSDVLHVTHGPMVEVGDGWCVEAVWAGPFSEGNFDLTDLVFGTGVRCREDSILFVTSGTVFDRIWYCRNGDVWFFSNSLPALLAVADLELRNDYLGYSQDVRSIVRGLENRVRSIPTTTVDVFSVYFNNLRFNGSEVFEEPKPDTAPTFRSYSDYRTFLSRTAQLLGQNLGAPDRKHKIHPLTSISSGYDSCVAAVVSREAGCRESVTISESTSMWRGSDSGAPVAQHLGIDCREYPRTAKDYPHEVAVWAAEGRAGILNWMLFDYPEPLCLFFTGCHGEKMWDRVLHDHTDPFIRRDPASLGFCEARLFIGAFQCVVPFWGVRHSQELRGVTESEEMRPFYTNKDYDKPIARRILEEVGVPGELFGTIKKNTSHEAQFRWPYSRPARDSLRSYLLSAGKHVPSDLTIQLLRLYSRANSLLYDNTLRKIGHTRGPQFWHLLSDRSCLFQWANAELKKYYADSH